jgi:hypothetical protein
VVVGQSARLIGDRIGDLDAAVTGVHAPKSRHRVEVPTAARVAHARASAFDDHEAGARLLLRDRGERMQPGAIELSQGCGPTFRCYHARAASEGDE